MKTENIQIIVTGVFIFFAVVGVILFSVSSTKKGVSENPRVVVWGLLKKSIVTPIIEQVNLESPGTINLEYIEKENEAKLEADLIATLLDGVDIPDGLIIPDRLLTKLQKRLTLIAWTAVSERNIKDNYSQAGEVFFGDQGTYAIPFLIDPMILFWNRDVFNSKLITNVPQTWEEVAKLVPVFTERKEDKTISKSTLALGEYQNIKYAKEIVAALALQSGINIIAREDQKLTEDILSTDGSIDGAPLFQSVLAYYTQFADPASSFFSWSRALPDALTVFLAGNSAMYIGFGSEVEDMRSKNPNLNIDIALLPQAAGKEKKVTFGNVYGIALVDGSNNKSAMLNTALLLTNKVFQQKFAEATRMAPVRRDMLGNPPGSGVADVVWKSALWTHSWVDPDYTFTSIVFKNMIELVTSGKETVAGAIVEFQKEVNELLQKYNK